MSTSQVRQHRIDMLPWQDLEPEALTTDAVIVPIGCVEPHGNHAPLGTDTFIATGIADLVAQATGALVFPAIPLGTLDVLYDFKSAPGAISLDNKLLIELYTNIGTELIRQGFKRILFVNGHSGNAPLLQIAAFEVKDRAGGQAAVLDWWSSAKDVIDEIKGHSWGTHADEIETSILMAAAGEHLVDLSKAVANSPGLEDLGDDERSLYQQKITFTRVLDQRWLGCSGNMGDPTLATVEHGHRILAKVVEVAAQILSVMDEQAKHEAKS